MRYIIIALISYFTVRWAIDGITFLKKNRPFTQASMKRLGLFCGALALIGGVEFVMPSTPLTGLSRSIKIEPPRYLDAQPVIDTPVTYGDLAQSSPMLWSLGTLTRDEMERRLASDITATQARLEEIAESSKTARLLRRSFPNLSEYEAIRQQIMLAGLQSAVADLDTLFVIDTISVSAADHFMRDQLSAASAAIRSEANDRYTELSEQLAAFTIPDASPQQIAADADYIALREQRDAARSRSISVSAATSRFTLRGGQPDSPITQQTPFPQFDGPLLVFEVTRTGTSQNDAKAQIGPQTSSPAGFLALQDAITGRLRHGGMGISEARCSVGVVEKNNRPTLERFCELSAPLRLNYDLTGRHCSTQGHTLVSLDELAHPGTQVSAHLCKESWIFPHLNVLFTDDSITVYPPLPAYGDNQDVISPPLSHWTVSWQDQEHSLDAPVTLPWNGEDSRLPGLALTHGTRPVVRNAQIWDDFRQAFPWSDLLQEIRSSEAAEQNIYEPKTYTGFAHPFAVVEGFMSFGLPPAEDTQYVIGLRAQVHDRLSAVRTLAYRTNLSNLTDPTRTVSAACNVGGFLASPDAIDKELSESLVALATQTSSDPCETYQAYATLLDISLRNEVAGSWLWMMDQ